MAEAKLLLQESKVWSGMILVVSSKDKAVPECRDSKELIVKVIFDPVQSRNRFYIVNCSIENFESGQVDQFKIGPKPIDGHFSKDVTFAPFYAFSVDDAPINTRYVVYDRKERLMYAGKHSDHFVVVRKDKKGRILSDNGYAHSFWQKVFDLPSDAILVPVSELGKYFGVEGS